MRNIFFSLSCCLFLLHFKWNRFCIVYSFIYINVVCFDMNMSKNPMFSILWVASFAICDVRPLFTDNRCCSQWIRCFQTSPVLLTVFFVHDCFLFPFLIVLYFLFLFFISFHWLLEIIYHSAHNWIVPITAKRSTQIDLIGKIDRKVHPNHSISFLQISDSCGPKLLRR